MTTTGEDAPPPPGRRPLSRWILLFTVYAAGLLVWTAYIAALVFLFFRFLV